ncbi:hypothetical protein HAX54_016599 [Datura stramonium]|uniref:Uncharacterized protein n=1 Tax=Datura stramonium TaxID=4076 RepID=A0ABS8UJ69_DATST|nr:hypothetical protein [Datura stramonium]
MYGVYNYISRVASVRLSVCRSRLDVILNNRVRLEALNNEAIEQRELKGEPPDRDSFPLSPSRSSSIPDMVIVEDVEDTHNEDLVPRGRRYRLDKESTPSGSRSPLRARSNEANQPYGGEQYAEGVDTQPP